MNNDYKNSDDIRKTYVDDPSNNPNNRPGFSPSQLAGDPDEYKSKRSEPDQGAVGSDQITDTGETISEAINHEDPSGIYSKFPDNIRQNQNNLPGGIGGIGNAGKYGDHLGDGDEDITD